MASLQDMQASLVKVVSNVRQNSESVATASSQISQGNNDLSQRTEEQASALEETAASMEQLGATVKQNADNAGQASQLAFAARDTAEKGGAVVSKAVKAMGDINVGTLTANAPATTNNAAVFNNSIFRSVSFDQSDGFLRNSCRS